MPHYVYMRKSISHKKVKTYVGYSINYKRRLIKHNLGKGAKYTKTRTPVSLIYKESFDTKEESLKREIEIKKLKRKQKLDLIN